MRASVFLLSRLSCPHLPVAKLSSLSLVLIFRGSHQATIYPDTQVEPTHRPYCAKACILLFGRFTPTPRVSTLERRSMLSGSGRRSRRTRHYSMATRRAMESLQPVNSGTPWRESHKKKVESAQGVTGTRQKICDDSHHAYHCHPRCQYVIAIHSIC